MLDKFHIIIWKLLLRRLLQPLIYLIFSLFFCYFTHQDTNTCPKQQTQFNDVRKKNQEKKEKKIVNSFIEIFAAAALNSLMCSAVFIHSFHSYIYILLLLFSCEWGNNTNRCQNDEWKYTKNTQIYNFSTLSFYSSSPSDYNTYIYFICFPLNYQQYFFVLFCSYYCCWVDKIPNTKNKRDVKIFIHKFHWFYYSGTIRVKGCLSWREY